MRRAIWLLLALATAACPGDLAVGAKCSSPDGGDPTGVCDVRVSFCGEQTPGSGNFVCIARPATPYIHPDRMQLDFVSRTTDLDPNQSLMQTLQLFNEGIADLHISGVSVSGPNAGMFTASIIGVSRGDGGSAKDLPLKVVSRGAAFVQIAYAPKGEVQRTAQLDIASDAKNAATLSIPIDAEPPQPDGGM